MQSMTPITPLESGVEMFQKGKLQPFFTARQDKPRPVSEVTQIFDTDFEDDESESEFEEDSPKYSFDSYESRRSQTTISTYDEVPTPHLSRKSTFELQIQARMQEMKPVEGPKGPHLFRASQSSSEFSFDYALQMSPLLPKQPPPRIETAFREPSHPRAFNSLPDAVAGLDSSEVRTWSAQQVASWMYSSGFEESIIEKFEVHDITGAVLLDLQFEDLKELDIQSFGKRHQLWNEIDALRGNEGRDSPVHTPFQDISRPCTRNTRSNSMRERSRSRAPRDGCDSAVDGNFTPITPGEGRRRRGRKNRNVGDDVITPAESVSIVAIEQLLPKPHKCPKGERCQKWKKQQRQLARLQEEHGFPISPEKGGHIFVAGDPGNAATTAALHSNIDLQRPTSDVVPSVVASSDLLGPGQLPEFALQEDYLRNFELRDPQENVKHFLTLQHMEAHHMHNSPPPVEPPTTPPLEMFPPLHPPEHTPGPHYNLKSLPKLSIPRSASANPYVGSQTLRPAGPSIANGVDTFTPCRSATASPGGASLYRFGTPASEMDVPVTAIPLGPVSRDASQSVPPNMQFRDPVHRSGAPSRGEHWRRPSFLPQLNEDEVFSPTSPSSDTLHESNPDSETAQSMGIHAESKMSQQPKKKTSGFQYNGVNHHGWMKKRRTKLLRHEWHDQHFRLTGTQLAMHANSLPTSSPLDTIDVDEYAVACSSLASNKLAAKLKTLKITGEKKNAQGVDPTAFTFQLVPTGPNEKDAMVVKKVVNGKTHHFAVKTRDERIDWMRELMLAKALKAKGEGYEVQVNGAVV
ncbi:hypothetical protein H2201_001033 [Coniosporium apollinis]|uniref:SAM and PH domain-containing protein n=1 Tax=Coniosporium apollinis TaxID=61459 RepID=A0ABQ9P3E2_9PEZI|nr:hypothetical protein H2201_001033 [Coniosporium apollinis]